uniref:(northern house mosquito) hypothetical protein n=1 Tax=Culex pipiens TaxID=7175 RepID=A0A8D8B7X0_CULPI
MITLMRCCRLGRLGRWSHRWLFLNSWSWLRHGLDGWFQPCRSNFLFLGLGVFFIVFFFVLLFGSFFFFGLHGAFGLFSITRMVIFLLFFLLAALLRFGLWLLLHRSFGL